MAIDLAALEEATAGIPSRAIIEISDALSSIARNRRSDELKVFRSGLKAGVSAKLNQHFDAEGRHYVPLGTEVTVVHAGRSGGDNVTVRVSVKGWSGRVRVLKHWLVPVDTEYAAYDVEMHKMLAQFVGVGGRSY